MQAQAQAQDDAKEVLAEARSLALAGRHAEAVPLYERLVSDVEQERGSDASSLIFLLYELAVQHHGLGAFDEAESLYHRSLVVAETHRGKQDPTLVPSLRGLATIAATNSRLDEAERLYRRALGIQEAAEDDRGTARTLAELGVLCQLQGRSEDAELFYRRALESGEANHLEMTELAMIAGNLGALCDQQGRHAEAEVLFQRVLTIREGVLGSDHPDLATVHEKLGGLQFRQHRFSEAAASFTRSLKIREQAGPEDLAVVEVLGHLAASYRRLDRPVAAKAHLEMAKTILDAQCSGKERTAPCRKAIRSYRDLRGKPLVTPIEPLPQPPDTVIASSPTPSAPPAAAPPSPPSAPPTEANLPPATPAPSETPQPVQETTTEPRKPVVTETPTPRLPPAPSEATPHPAPEEPVVAETPTASPPPAPPVPSDERPVVAETPVASPPPPTAVARSGKKRSGKVQRAQVGAREDPLEAAEILARLQAAHPELLTDLPTRVVRVDLGERGVWHRVQLGEYEWVAEAKALCDALAQRGHEGCWVITDE